MNLFRRKRDCDVISNETVNWSWKTKIRENCSSRKDDPKPVRGRKSDKSLLSEFRWNIKGFGKAIWIVFIINVLHLYPNNLVTTLWRLRCEVGIKKLLKVFPSCRKRGIELFRLVIISVDFWKLFYFKNVIHSCFWNGYSLPNNVIED